MKFWDKFWILYGVKSHEYSEEIDQFLINNFIDNPKAKFVCYLDSNYYIVVSNGKRYYKMWNENRWYSWIQSCYRTSINKEKSNSKLRVWENGEKLWDGLQPSPKCKIAFINWLEQFDGFVNPQPKRMTKLTDEELEGVIGGNDEQS